MPIKVTVKKKFNHSFLKPVGHLFEEATATYKKVEVPSQAEPESVPESEEEEIPWDAYHEANVVRSMGFGNIKLVGQGAMGKVFVGTWDSQDGVERAIKIVERENAVRELNAYRIISNARSKDPIIAKHFPAELPNNIFRNSNNNIFVVLDFCRPYLSLFTRKS